MHHRIPKRTGLLRYVFSYILLISLPFGILMGFFSSYFFNEYRASLMNNSFSSLLSIQKSYELLFTQMDNIAEQLGRETEFLSFDLDRNLSTTMRLKNRLAGYKASNSNFDSLLYFRRGGQLLCAHDSTYQLATYATRVNHMSQTTPEQFANLLETCQVRTILGPQHEKLYAQAEGEYISFVYPLSAPGGEPKATLIFKFSLDVLESMLQVSEDSSYSVAIPTADSFVVLSSHPSFAEHLPVIEPQLGSDSLWTGVVSIEKERYLVSCCQNPDMGVRYFYETPEQLAMANLLRQKHLLFVLIGLLSVAEIVGILYLGYKRFRPLQLLQELLDSRFAGYSGSAQEQLPVYGRPVESAKQVLQALDSRQDLLEEQLKAQEIALRDMILYKLVSGGFTSESRVEESLQQARIQLSHVYVCAGILQCSGTLPIEVYAEIFSKELQMDQLYLFHLTKTRYIFLFSSELENPAQEKQLFDACIQRLRERDKACCLGVGNPVRDRLRLRISFQQALHSLDYALKHHHPFIAYLDIFSSYHSFFADYPFAAVQHLRRDLTEENEESFCSCLQEIRQNLSRHSSEYVYVTSLVYDCANSIFSAFVDKNADALSVSECMSLIVSTSNAEEALALFEKAASAALAYFAQRREGMHSELVERAVLLIHQNLENYHFSLASLAEELNVTPSNLSQQFKRRMKQTPMDYFNALKIERIKYYMQTTNMTNKKIMEQMGYVSEASFVRMFRKRVGMTPGEYRKNIASAAIDL